MGSEEKVSAISVLKFGGAFVAFMIGSGFASGQEIMQFFTAYGYLGIVGACVSMFLFAWSGVALMCRGYDTKDDAAESKQSFDHWLIFTDKKDNLLYYVGRGISIFFEWFVPLFLFSVVVIMVSGAGATMNEYYGLPVEYGCFIMALAVLISVLFGLRRIIDIIGALGPFTILFTIIIAIGAIAINPSGLSSAQEVIKTGVIPSATKFWWVSGVLYVAYNVTGSVPFLTSMGASANSRREAKLGAIVGSLALMLAGVLLLVGQLTYAGDVATLSVPNLFLANRLTPLLANIFSVILIGEIYSTAAPMLWVTCDRFTKEGTSGHKVLVVVLSAIAYFGGQLPFGTLVGTVYPYVGYLGIFFFICILIRQMLPAQKV
ncbi:MAG: hypothetical protein LBJ36_03680 [Synergistaceae bacterium]|jgi:uncharacterized membrane protein YkvI|nr:hypothetical protein [Synergistaceae bacterium]